MALEIETKQLRTTTRCPQCKETAAYAISSGSMNNADRFDVLGVIAVDDRTDRAPVQVQASQGAGAIAITCPQCNAALEAASESTLVTCKYCQTRSRIPQKLWYRLTGAATPQPWWILFQKASAKRRSLERKRVRGGALGPKPRQPTRALERYLSKDFESPWDGFWLAVAFPFMIYGLIENEMKSRSRQESEGTVKNIAKLCTIVALVTVSALAAQGRTLPHSAMWGVVGYLALTLPIGVWLSRSSEDGSAKTLARRLELYIHGDEVDAVVVKAKKRDDGVHVEVKHGERTFHVALPTALGDVADDMKEGALLPIVVLEGRDDAYASMLLANPPYVDVE